MDSLARRKAALRARMKERRAALTAEARAAAGERVAQRLFDLPSIRNARTVLSFSSFGSEVPTDALTSRLGEAGRRVLLPYLEGREIQAASVTAGDRLVPTSYGPMEPATRVAVDPGEAQVVLVPGLAFDRRGYRVGYGGGHYDRYLRRLAPDAVRIGIAFDEQLVPSVPHGGEDEPVDVIVTDRRVIDCWSERGGRTPPGR